MTILAPDALGMSIIKPISIRRKRGKQALRPLPVVSCSSRLGAALRRIARLPRLADFYLSTRLTPFPASLPRPPNISRRACLVRRIFPGEPAAPARTCG
jgi:hypothetical protein